MKKPLFMIQLKSFFKKCKRVWMTMKKPSKEEFQTIAKVSALGILVIGLIGFLFSILMQLFK